MALLELAQRHRFAVLEDDYDHEFHYEGRPVLPMASSDTSGQIVYIGTLSKLVAPGLRIGYLVAPRAFIAQLAATRFLLDRQGDGVTELALAQLLRDGTLQRHARRARAEYRLRRDTFITALRQELGAALCFDVPRGGMALWVHAPHVNVDVWAAEALKRGVLFNTARHYDFHGKPSPFVRLGYAAHETAELVQAARVLGRAYRAVA